MRQLRFKHIPKNGGTYIRKSTLNKSLFNKYDKDKGYKNITVNKTHKFLNIKLRSNPKSWSKHIPLSFYPKSYLKKYHFFVIIRNPYDRVISAINHFFITIIQGNENSINNHKNMDKTKQNLIIIFILPLIHLYNSFYYLKIPYFEHFLPQVKYYSTRHKKKCNFILYDNYNQELRQLYKKYGILFKKGHPVTYKKKTKYTNRLWEISKIIIRFLYNDDFKIHNKLKNKNI